MSATLDIPAESMEQAKLIAEQGNSIPDGDYIDDSLTVDSELTEELNDCQG